jgi:hypothetical protein
MASLDQISALIVKELAAGEKGILALTVAIRRTLGGADKPKGDLSQMVKATLRKLVASRTIVDDDGRYSLLSRI